MTGDHMRRRTLATTIALLALCTTRSAAQETAGWAISLEIGRDAFGGGSLDSVTAQPAEVEVLPAPRLAIEFGARHRFGGWEAGLSAGYAAGHLRAESGDVSVDSRSTGFTRYRLAGTIAHRLARLQSATLLAGVGPVLDFWRGNGLGERMAPGGRANVSLRVPLGRVELENVVQFTIGGSPFDSEGVPPGVALKPLRTWGLGVGLSYRL
jgi:hypothetical protein